MTDDGLLSRLKALVGREFTFTAPEEVGFASIRQFALAVGDLNPLYMDHALAGASPHGGIVAPPTFICETSQYLPGAVDEEHGAINPASIPTGGVIRMGNDYQFFRLVRPSDVVTAQWRVAECFEREGKSGRMAFLVMEKTFRTQSGELLATSRETCAYRLSGGGRP